jgi:hypothetical protein
MAYKEGKLEKSHPTMAIRFFYYFTFSVQFTGSARFSRPKPCPEFRGEHCDTDLPG